MADLWVSLLKAAQIPAYIPGEHLVDNVAISQRLNRNYAEDVFVPRSRLAEARQVIEKQPAPPDFDQQALEAESPETEPDA